MNNKVFLLALLTTYPVAAMDIIKIPKIEHRRQKASMVLHDAALDDNKEHLDALMHLFKKFENNPGFQKQDRLEDDAEKQSHTKIDNLLQAKLLWNNYHNTKKAIKRETTRPAETMPNQAKAINGNQIADIAMTVLTNNTTQPSANNQMSMVLAQQLIEKASTLYISDLQKTNRRQKWECWISLGAGLLCTVAGPLLTKYLDQTSCPATDCSACLASL